MTAGQAHQRIRIDQRAKGAVLVECDFFVCLDRTPVAFAIGAVCRLEPVISWLLLENATDRPP